MNRSLPARYWQPEENLAVRCLLCPHQCRIPDGGKGRCSVRINQGGSLYSAVWGNPAAIAVDPIEKKPLAHFLPGSSVLSLGTWGCNLSCRFCQNWELSHPSSVNPPGPKTVMPAEVVRAAVRDHIPTVAATYNEPAVWAEYAMDIADECHAQGLRMVAVTSGWFSPAPAREFFGKMDAANVDLKSFRDVFYREQCGAGLAPVLETLEMIRKETGCWLEVTTLLIPGLNDSEKEVDELTAWVAGHLGVDTPLHLTAFHPAGELMNTAPTPLETLGRARDQACQNGLQHVYVGNVRAIPDWTNTYCPECGAELVRRSGFSSKRTGLDAEGRCRRCRRLCSGVWQ